MKLPIKKLTIISMLITLSVVGRITFTFLPNIQPSTAIIIISSFFLGPVYGVVVAAMSAILSNMSMGMGLWTFGQILAWSTVGILSGLIGKHHKKIPFILLIAFSVICGFLFGFIISIPMYLFTGKFFAYYIAGLPFDINHAIGNGIFFAILYPIISKLFERFYK